VKPCLTKSGDNVDELKDIGFPVSEKISQFAATLAVQLPKCNYTVIFRVDVGYWNYCVVCN